MYEHVPAVRSRRPPGPPGQRLLPEPRPEAWGERRPDEPAPSEIKQPMGFVQTHLATHCNARGDGLLTPSGVVPQALLVPRALRGLLDNRGDRAWLRSGSIARPAAGAALGGHVKAGSWSGLKGFTGWFGSMRFVRVVAFASRGVSGALRPNWSRRVLMMLVWSNGERPAGRRKIVPGWMEGWIKRAGTRTPSPE